MRKFFTNKKYRPILIVIGILIVLGILLLILTLNSRVTPNPKGTIGNSAGNLNNSGLFCEYNDKVYFSNAFDGGALYSMDVNEQNIKRISTASVCNILAGGDYLYYFQLGNSSDSGVGVVRSPRSFNRCKLNGKDVTGIARDVVVKGQLVDDYLYLMTTGDDELLFYKIKTDKSDRVDLATYDINPASVQNGIIYYSGTLQDHYLYSLNTANDVSKDVWSGNLCYPIVEGDYVYYMDIDHNYRLCRYSLSQEVVEVLTEERVDCFNVGYGYIYYQTNSATPKLMCMNTNGSNQVVVMEGVYTNINLTSRYAYFQEFKDDETLYHSALGSRSGDRFSPALKAAQENQ